MITIQINGEEKEVQNGSVAELLADLSLPIRKIAVERNLEIVPRSAFATTVIAPGDRIEIVQFVGGG
ncbi:MAG: sulfur carrier protein ThiS [Pseudomonadota bacterium]